MFDPTAFSEDFQLPSVDPAPDPEGGYPVKHHGVIWMGPNGPWVSHGVVHTSKEPRH